MNEEIDNIYWAICPRCGWITPHQNNNNKLYCKWCGSLNAKLLTNVLRD